jgi:hypothetical protein
MEDRIALEMERENISRKEAERILKSDDEQRRRWSKYLCGLDTQDPSLYDMVLHIKTLTPNDAVDLICHTAGLPHFQTTPQSQKVLEDHLLASEVKSAIIDIKPDIDVSAKDGDVLVQTKGHISQEDYLTHKIKESVANIEGIKNIRVDVHVRKMTI